MRKTILSLLASISFLLSHSQSLIPGFYQMDGAGGSDVNCTVTFSKKGCYSLEISEKVSPDVINTTTLSAGRYSRRGIEIVLTDAFHGFRMTFRLSKDGKITPSKSFVFMRGKPFTYGGVEDLEDCPLQNLPTRKKDTNKQLSSNGKLFSFSYSTYESKDNTIVPPISGGQVVTGRGYTLEIQKSGGYKLTYKGLSLSLGNWERRGNDLLLSDSGLGCSFRLLIAEKGLISQYLPGDFRGVDLVMKTYAPRTGFLPKPRYKAGAAPVVEDNDEPPMFVRDMPRFAKGGEKGMQRFLALHLRYPADARKGNVRGRVLLMLIVEKDGSVGKVRLLKGLTESCDKEALRLVRIMPKWIPGRENGKNLAVRVPIAISFPAGKQ